MASRRGRRANAAADAPEGAPQDTTGAMPVTPTEELIDAIDQGNNERVPTAAVRRYDALGRAKYLDTVDASLVTEEWLAATYGGGKYIAQFRGRHPETGKWGWVKSATFDVDESLPFRGSLRSQGGARDIGPPVGGFVAGESRVYEPSGRVAGTEDDGMRGGDALLNSGILSLMREQQESQTMSRQMFIGMLDQQQKSSQALNTMMMQMFEAQRSSRVDWTALLGVLLPVVPAILERLTPKAGESLGVSDILALVRETRPKDEGTKLADTLDLVARIREVMGDGDGDGGGGMLGKVMDVLPSLLARVPASGTGAAPISANPVVTSTMSTMGPATAPSQLNLLTDNAGDAVPSGDVWAYVGGYVDRLLLAARLGRSARGVAVLVAEMTDAAQRAALEEVLATDGYRAELMRRFPALATRAVWMEDFLTVLEDEILGPAESDDSADGATDDAAGDVADDAADDAAVPVAKAVPKAGAGKRP